MLDRINDESIITQNWATIEPESDADSVFFFLVCVSLVSTSKRTSIDCVLGEHNSNNKIVGIVYVLSRCVSNQAQCYSKFYDSNGTLNRLNDDVCCRYAYTKHIRLSVSM